MKNWTWVMPALLGFVSVLQAGLNRRIGSDWGLAGAALLNCLVLLAVAAALFLVTKAQPQALPEIFRDRGSFAHFLPWYFIPGVLGLVLVAGIPFAISELGALRVFVPLIAAQILGSILWDLKVEGLSVSFLRAAGSALALVGAVLVSL